MFGQVLQSDTTQKKNCDVTDSVPILCYVTVFQFFAGGGIFIFQEICHLLIEQIQDPIPFL